MQATRKKERKKEAKKYSINERGPLSSNALTESRASH